MANGPGGVLALPETEDPLQNSLQQQPTPEQLMARQAGAVAMPSAPQTGTPQQKFQGFGAPGGQQRLNDIYGLLAQYSDDPSKVGQGYVAAMQRQQALSRENTPMARWLQLYGNINPHDFTSDSMAKFHDNLVATGQINYRLLDRREMLTDKETQMIADADHEAAKLSQEMMTADDLAKQYEDLHLRGVSGGLVADVKRWLNTKMGREGDDDLVYRRFDALKNSSVITGLPPGVASDRDIEIAMRGWPGATANPAHLMAFLRGRQKMLAIQHAHQAHESYFIGKHRTRAGLAQDWESKKKYYAMDALERFGGVYMPKDANGNLLNADQAAEYKFLEQKQRIHPETAAAGQSFSPGGMRQPVMQAQPGAQGDPQLKAMQKYNIQ